MATTKVTFTLDRISIDRLQDAAERLSVSKSEIVRETPGYGRSTETISKTFQDLSWWPSRRAVQ